MTNNELFSHIPSTPMPRLERAKRRLEAAERALADAEASDPSYNGWFRVPIELREEVYLAVYELECAEREAMR